MDCNLKNFWAILFQVVSARLNKKKSILMAVVCFSLWELREYIFLYMLKDNVARG